MRSRVKCFLSLLMFAAAVSLPAELREVVIEDFHSRTPWSVHELLNPLLFQAELRFFEGSPSYARQLQDEDTNARQYSLGMKYQVDALEHYRISIEPKQPLPLGPGPTKIISLWVQGHNRDHDLYLRLLDPDGDPLGDLHFGRLNFSGWKRMTAALIDVPVNQDLSIAAIVLKISPFEVAPAPEYYYFYHITAITDEVDG